MRQNNVRSSVVSVNNKESSRGKLDPKTPDLSKQLSLNQNLVERPLTQIEISSTAFMDDKYNDQTKDKSNNESIDKSIDKSITLADNSALGNGVESKMTSSLSKSQAKKS